MPLYIDEAGRGPLAGPVRVGIIYVQNPQKIRFETDIFADSKILTEKKRNLAYDYILKLKSSGQISVSSGKSSAKFINQKGIVIAIRQAILKAIKKLEKQIGKSLKNEKIFIDGNTSFGLEKFLDGEIETIIKGDQKVKFISMASIVAKVERDKYMKKLSKKFPEYGFEKHKGYGTKLHREMILKYGACEIHRKLYLRKLLGEK